MLSSLRTPCSLEELDLRVKDDAITIVVEFRDKVTFLGLERWALGKCNKSVVIKVIKILSVLIVLCMAKH